MKNHDVRQLIKRNRFRHYEVAHELGISEYTLSVWLRTELLEARKAQVIQAIDRLVQKMTGGVDVQN
jgi:predicted XRE-type DNA-binding protein